MGKEQRYCTIYVALLVNEMYVERFKAVHLYGGLEVWQLVEPSFLLPPIEILFPVRSQSFYISQWGTVVPSRLIKFVREVCDFKLLDKSFALFLGD